MKKNIQMLKGILICVIISIISFYISKKINISFMLIAVLIGILSSTIYRKSEFKLGIDFCSNFILKSGVALLGFRFSYDSFLEIGVTPILMIMTLVICIIISGILLAKFFKKEIYFGVLSGGAVAICGASAAVALSSVMSLTKKNQNFTSTVIIGVTILSTLSMILYPLIFQSFLSREIALGFLFGTSIHDVAGVVGAGYMINDQVGLYSTFFKMIRVAFLPFVLLFVTFYLKGNNKNVIYFPRFLILFFCFAVLRNLYDFSDQIIFITNNFSIFLLLVSISSVGLKTDFSILRKFKSTYFLILLIETLLILIFSFIFSRYYNF